MVPVIAVPYLSRVTRTPPPGVKTEGLVEVVTTPRGPRGAGDAWSYPDFVDLRAADTGMSDHRLDRRTEQNHDSDSSRRRDEVRARRCSSPRTTSRRSVWRWRGGRDSARRWTTRRTAEPVVILGYAFWQNQLGSDPDIVGKTLTLDDIPHVVVGIAPERFDGHLFLHGKELFVPLEQHPRLRDRNAENTVRSDRNNEWIYIIGRLSPGVGMAQATAAVSAVTSQLAKQYPVDQRVQGRHRRGVSPERLSRAFSIPASFEAVALTLTGTVLIVVCLNISGMMQVRSAMRERELSIRQAIGASRGRLVQYLLSEAIILAGLGCALGSVVLFNIPAGVFLVRPGVPFRIKSRRR